MLPSRGFFKKNDCPFFEKGLCVRPHCHFRHRKKILSENSSSLDSQEDLVISESLADIPLVGSIKSTSVPASTSTSDNIIHHSSDVNIKTKEDSNQSSLFAKLVNQSNPYEKISRHIPCAYTPTPQTRTVQPKNKSVVQNVRSSRSSSTETISNSVFNNYKSVTTIQNDSNTLEQQNNSNTSSNYVSGKSSYVSDSSQNSILCQNSSTKVSLGDKNTLDSLSYEPQSTTKLISSSSYAEKEDGGISNYVPSKVLTSESKYIPGDDVSKFSNIYIPSNDKSKQSQYVPEGSGNSKNEITYKPSGKTTGETQYQPGNSSCVADYVPTEKSAISVGSSWSGDDTKNDLTEFEFISSEIELMKELLKEEINEKKNKTEKSSSKNEVSEDKEKKVKTDKNESKSSKHSHSSKHRSSSHGSKSKTSSSTKKHSSSRSSSHSHSSSSSKHHSSSKSNKSSHSHRSSSSSHKKSSSSSHKKHSTKDKSHKSRHGEKSSKNTDKKKREHLDKKDSRDNNSVSSEEEMNNSVDYLPSDDDNSIDEGGSENEIESRKRKISSDDDENSRTLKLLKREELFDELEDDPDTVEKQCLEIFNSYSNDVAVNGSRKIKEITVPPEEYESTIQGKKRTAHSTFMTSDHSVLRQKTVKKMNTIKSAQDVMLERYKAVEKNKEIQKPLSVPQPAPLSGLSRPAIRIAAVSNIQQMLQAKKAIQDKINQGLKINERTTIAHTAVHGSSRIAHTPASKEMVEKPTVTGGSKQVPRIKRQIYLEKLLVETNKIYPTKDESVEVALKLEEEIFQANSGSSSAYRAAFICMLMKTRRKVAALQGEAPRSNVSRLFTVSHNDVLSGGKKNFSVIKTKKVDISMLSERHIYEELFRCKLTVEELKENSFPMEGKKPGYATCSINFELKYNDKYRYIKKLKGNLRYCIRCSKQYEVDPVTFRQYKEGPETCSYHPGKKKFGGKNCDRVYNCCNTSSTEGCATHIRHVTDCNDYENLPNCVKTLSKENEKNPGVYALDCEMVYTRLGCELARVTVVNLKKEIVYDTLVKPKYPVECYNTFYSGIEEKMLEGVETSLKDVQAVLLSMFSDKTILVGHSLDSDLRALHLIHDTVVDTSVFYKNEKYHPYKYSLKDLCAKKISKIIQDNVGGHDSAEDAIAALEIMLNHVKEEVRKYDSIESYEADRML